MSKILKLARAFQGLTQAEAANKLGVAKSYISEIESGRRPISLQTIRRYAKLLEIPASSLLLFMEKFEGEEYLPAEEGPWQTRALKLFSWLQAHAGIKDPDEDAHPTEIREDDSQA